MEVIQSLLTKLLPIIIALALGAAIRKTSLLDVKGIAALKTAVTRVTLPFVIFQAFYKVEYQLDTFITAVTVLLICLMLFALGFLLKKSMKNLTSLLPFTLAGFEMGMLGFPLFLLLAGQENMGSIAVADLGQEVFVFTLYLFMLRRQTGGEQSLKASVRETARNPVIIAVALGLLAGITGLGRLITGTLAGEVTEAVCGFISAPTAVLILLSIGYDLKLERRLLKRAGLAMLLRAAAVLLIGGGLTFLLFQIIPYDPWLLLAILTMLVLPAPFVLPVYSQSREEAQFVSMFLSLSTLLFVLLYAVLLGIKPLIVG